MASLKEIQSALEKSWSARTSYLPHEWTLVNRARGQCAVTALIVQDELSGDIIKCDVVGENETHFYNKLSDNTVLDLTRSQFKDPVVFSNERIANRDEILSHPGTQDRYSELKNQVNSNFIQAHMNFDTLLKNYETANNSHDWSKVEPFIHPNASYFFTDGTFIGLEAIKGAITATFAKIQNETYKVSDIEWVISEHAVAACRYRFNWKGIVDGEQAEGSGRGTNIWKNEDGTWKIIHEHLSK